MGFDLEKDYKNLDPSIALIHSGRKGMHWGIRNGPPYPLDEAGNARFEKNKDASGNIANKEQRDRMKAQHGNYDGPDEYAREEELEKDVLGRHPSEKLKDLKHLDNDTQEEAENALKTINTSDVDMLGRDFNCMNCTAAFEMIQRGYDVGSRPALSGSNVGDIAEWFKGGKLVRPISDSEVSQVRKEYQSADKLRISELEKLDEARKKYGFESTEYNEVRSKYDEACEYAHSKEHKLVEKCKECIGKIEENLVSFGEGARGIFVVGYDAGWSKKNKPDTKAFHAMNFQVINGQAVIFDSQLYEDAVLEDAVPIRQKYSVITRADPRELYYMRTDDLEPNESICNAVYSKR